MEHLVEISIVLLAFSSVFIFGMKFADWRFKRKMLKNIFNNRDPMEDMGGHNNITMSPMVSGDDDNVLEFETNLHSTKDDTKLN